MQVNSDPKYDTDAVNLRYLNKTLATNKKETDNKISQLNKNYGTQPSPPYLVGDTYTTGNQIYRCIKSREIGSFSMSDWQLVIDGGDLQKFIDNVYSLDKISIEEQLDNKIETYIQEEDPSLNWTTNIEKEKHKGDYWRKKQGNRYIEYCYTKYNTNPVTYAWAETDVPASVYDLIDGKKTIYTSKPSSYNKDDMWIIEETLNDDDLPPEVKQGDWVFATNNSDIYNKYHWVKKDEKVDIEYLEKNYYQTTVIDNKLTEIDRNTDSKITQAKDDISLSIEQSYTTKEETTSVINKLSNIEEVVGTITETTTEHGELLTQLSVGVGEIKSVVENTVQKQTNIENSLNETNKNLTDNYTTKTETSVIQQTINEISLAVQIGGGSNMLQNSVGLYGMDGITVENNRFYFKPVTNLVVGDTYTLTFKYSNETNNSIKVLLDNVNEEEILVTNQGVELDEVVYTFIAKDTNVQLIIEMVGVFDTLSGKITNLIGKTISEAGFILTDQEFNRSFLITDTIFRKSLTRNDWEPASGEILGTTLSVYYNGIEVSSINADIKTKINNMGFVVTNNYDQIVLSVTKDFVLLTNTQIDGDLYIKTTYFKEIPINGDRHLVVGGDIR